jgi:hypothetical protein
VTLTCAVGRFLKTFSHVKVRKIEKVGTNDPFAKVRLVYVASKISRDHTTMPQQMESCGVATRFVAQR